MDKLETPPNLTPSSGLKEMTSEGTLAVAGYLFIILSLVALTLVSILLYRGGLGSLDRELSWTYVVQVFIVPIFLTVIAGSSALLGLSMLQISGRSSRRVIHPDDYKLLSHMLISGNHAGIDDWVRLSSLTGVIGAFTKVGLYGLPLATIALTIAFAVLAALTLHWADVSKAMFDLSKLTLGAFIGSYVQRQAPDARAARTPKPGDKNSVETTNSERT